MQLSNQLVDLFQLFVLIIIEDWNIAQWTIEPERFQITLFSAKFASTVTSLKPKMRSILIYDNL